MSPCSAVSRRHWGIRSRGYRLIPAERILNNPETSLSPVKTITVMVELLWRNQTDRGRGIGGSEHAPLAPAAAGVGGSEAKFATGKSSAVSGGGFNTAAGEEASASGGGLNKAARLGSAIGGGTGQEAAGTFEFKP